MIRDEYCCKCGKWTEHEEHNKVVENVHLRIVYCKNCNSLVSWQIIDGEEVLTGNFDPRTLRW